MYVMLCTRHFSINPGPRYKKTNSEQLGNMSFIIKAKCEGYKIKWKMYKRYINTALEKIIRPP